MIGYQQTVATFTMAGHAQFTVKEDPEVADFVRALDEYRTVLNRYLGKIFAGAKPGEVCLRWV